MRGGASQHEKIAATELGMEYVSIPWHCPFPHDEPFAKFLKLIEDNPRKKLFVHCRLGDDRTGMAIAAYRMGIEGWSADEAMKEMRMFGFTGVHHLICPWLAGYEKSFSGTVEKGLGVPGFALAGERLEVGPQKSFNAADAEDARSIRSGRTNASAPYRKLVFLCALCVERF